MANTKSAAKRSRQTAKRTVRNRSVITRLRTMSRKLTGDAGQKDENSVRSMIAAVDKAANRGIIHRNAANRRKARLAKSLRAGATAAAPAPAAPAATE
jgi:small subunit ribosomal protein S20